jgi:hypothetical protein
MRLLPLLLVAAALAGSAAAASPPSEGARCSPKLEQQYRRVELTCDHFVLVVPWSRLRRPLHVPSLPAGARCPTTAMATRDLFSFVGWGRGVPAWGSGPAYPVLSSDGGIPSIRVRLPPPEGFGTEWAVEKVLWFTALAFRGRVLVRGRQLDGPNEVRFEDGRPGFTDEQRLHPVTELRLERDSGGHPATTRVRAPGCYAYQLDGWRFSSLIVFEAVSK